jgi:hypothetical protein
VNDMFTAHAFTSLEQAVSLLGVVPDGLDNLCRNRDGRASKGLIVHSVRVVLVELCKLGINPIGVVRGVRHVRCVIFA